MHRPALSAHSAVLDQILVDDDTAPVKKRHSATRICERLPDVLVKSFVDEAVICSSVDIIVRHVRSYHIIKFIMVPLPCLPLIEPELNALDLAAALAD
jgi:hypothetical protein